MSKVAVTVGVATSPSTAGLNVNVAAVLDIERKLVSSAFVACIKHVPDEVAETVAVEVELLKAQPVAVLPVAAIAKVTAPFPLPPDVLMFKACEYGNALLLVVSDVFANVY